MLLGFLFLFLGVGFVLMTHQLVLSLDTLLEFGLGALSLHDLPVHLGEALGLRSFFFHVR